MEIKNQIQDLVLVNGLEAICHFDFVFVDKKWHVLVLFIDNFFGQGEPRKYAPYEDVIFVGDTDNQKKYGYLKDHLKFIKNKNFIQKIIPKIKISKKAFKFCLGSLN